MKCPPSHIPSGVWVLGLVSMLMDISSEMIHSLLPLFMVTILGANATVVGLIEGSAESLALVVKVFSGTLSDYLGRRKGLAVFGYALGALTKSLFALASGVGMVLTARLLDRVGKGVRGAPRDALVADIAPPHLRGAAFGLRQSLDTAGAFVGPLVAVGLMLLWVNDFQAVFWVAVIPGLMAVALLVFGVRAPVRRQTEIRTNPIRRDNLRRLDSAYWWVVGIGSVFTLARFSEAFLVLRAQQGGMPIALVPLVMMAMNLIYALSAVPVRQALRYDEPYEAACSRPDCTDCRRRGVGHRQSLEYGSRGRCLVGTAHGDDARLTGGHDRRCLTRGSSWDGIRLLQLGLRVGHVGR
ncbi:MAG: MFS transporter [Nitrospira sp.]|nr:MFS transporter [Nitrospira sp.]